MLKVPGIMKVLYILVLALFFSPCLKAQEGPATPKENPKGKRLIVEYHENGIVKHEHGINENAQLDGPAKWYFSNGNTLCIKNYKNGILDGEAKWYHDTGHLQIIRYYNNGKLSGKEYQFSSTGIKILETEWLDGKKHGLEKEFYETGELKTESVYDRERTVSTKIWSKNGILSSTSVMEANGRTRTRIYNEHGVISEAIYNKDGELAIIIDYANGEVMRRVEYRKTRHLMPSARVLLKFLGRENTYEASYEEPKNYDPLAQECLGEVITLEKTEAERAQLILRDGLLLYVISKAQNAQPFDEEYSTYRIISYMLLEALPYNIEINIQGVDYKTVIKEFEKEVKQLNKKIKQEMEELAYTSEKDAKNNLAKFARLVEPGRIKIEETSGIDFKFIKDQYERTQKAKDPEFKYKKLLQIKYILLGFYTQYYTDAESQEEIKNMLNDLDQLKLEEPAINFNDTALRKTLESYLMAPTDHYSMEVLVDSFINAVAQRYQSRHSITQMEADILFGPSGIYDLLSNLPEKDLELLQLAAFFYLLRNEKELKKYNYRSLEVFPYFNERIVYYGLKIKRIETSKDFRLFRTELISKNTKRIKIAGK